MGNMAPERPKSVYAAAPVRMGEPEMAETVADTGNIDDVPPASSFDEPPAIAVVEKVEKVVSEKKHSKSSEDKKEKKDKKDNFKRRYTRMAAGTVWEDMTLSEWDTDDFRMFCGDLGNEVTDDILSRAFNRYPSFQKARVIRDKRTNKTKGFGFVSFKDPADFARAMKEMNGRYVGNRPIKLRKSVWQDRQIDNVKKKEREKKKLGFR
jgi:RNA recognition motif-containing protein